MAKWTDLIQKYKNGITDYFNPDSNSGKNFWSTPAAEVLAGKRKLYQTELPKFTFADKSQDFLPKAAQFIGNLPSTIAEGLTQTPERLVSGATKTGAYLGQVRTGAEKFNPIKLTSNMAPYGEGMLDIATLGVGKEAVKQAGKQTLITFVKEGAKQGAKLGGVYGGLGGLEQSENANLPETALNVGTGTLIGGGAGVVAGGVLAGGGHIIRKEIKTYQKLTPKEKQAGFVRLPGTGKEETNLFDEPVTKPNPKPQQEVFSDLGKSTANENTRAMEKMRQNKYESIPQGQTPLETEVQNQALKEQMDGGLFGKKQAPEEVLNTVKEAVASGDEEGAKAIYGDLDKDYQLPSYQLLAEEVGQSQSKALGEVAGEVVQSQQNQPYGETINKFKNFLRIAGEKKSQNTGELFREHIPSSVAGVSSDEVASALGKTEVEFMSELMGDIKVVASGKATSQQISRFFGNVRKAHQYHIKLPKPISDFYNSLSEKDYFVLRSHGEFGQPVVVSAQAGEQTSKNIADKRTADIQKEAERVYNEWQGAIKQETVSSKGRLDQITNMVKDATDQAMKDKLSSRAGKVLLIDFRSPENVFKKLGLHEEVYMPLKRGQEATSKEIQNAYEKLNTWFKEVGGNSESSVKIFDWLDGQKDTPLTDTELKVATEIKQYLAEWATKLGLSESQRIRDYITHIFEKDLQGTKSIPEELTRILDFTKPRGTFDPYLEQRFGAKDYKHDVFAALDAYILRGARKLHLDQPVETAAKYADFEGSQAQRYLDHYLKNLMGRPDNFERWADENVIAALPERVRQALGPRPFLRIVSAVRGQVYRGALGLNFGSAVKNLTQNVNTLAELGPTKTVGGMVDLLRNGTKELIDNQVLEEMITADYKRKFIGTLSNKMDSKLFYLFELAEKMNRGTAYFAAKREALSRGMTEGQAVDFAKGIVRKTQFEYGKLGMPLALQSSLGKLGFQFASYPIKQAELLGGYVKNKEFTKMARYIISTIAVTASIGDLLGMDLGEFYNIFPTLGPIPQIGINTIGAVKGDWQAKSNLEKTPLLFVPGGLQVRKTFDAAQNIQRGYSATAAGKKRFPAPSTTGGQIHSLLFGQWATPEAEQYLIRKGLKDPTGLPFGLGTYLRPATPEEKLKKQKQDVKKKKEELLKRYQ